MIFSFMHLLLIKYYLFSFLKHFYSVHLPLRLLNHTASNFHFLSLKSHVLYSSVVLYSCTVLITCTMFPYCIVLFTCAAVLYCTAIVSLYCTAIVLYFTVLYNRTPFPCTCAKRRSPQCKTRVWVV